MQKKKKTFYSTLFWQEKKKSVTIFLHAFDWTDLEVLSNASREKKLLLHNK
jgi:hypothetical protein